MIHKVTVIGAIAVLGLTTGCVLEEDGREDSAIRGVWQSSGKADETATCAGACGEQSADGCWCDALCDGYGDCCPDKASVCGGGGGGDGGGDPGGAPAASGEPGPSLGTFELTYYWVTEESAFGGADNVKLYDDSCDVLATVPQGFADAIKLEGTGRLTDGTVLNYSGSCGCPNSPCYFAVDASHPWGHGVQNRALVPFRSVAVDKSVITYGDEIYIEELDGVTMPGESPWGGFVHDGCVSADDTGSAIIGKHLDFFSARKADYLALNGLLGVSHVTVREGGERCDGSGGGAPPPGGGGGGEDPPAPGGGGGDQLCFPGPSGDDSACVSLVDKSEVGSGYDYPAPYGGNANYRAPIRYIDLEAVGDLQVAANFSLSELAQSWKGRYAVVQPHAVGRLQTLRNQLGAIKVNSGYRSPAYNASVDGATHSRHMYGDAFDLDPVSASLSTLESACSSNGGMLVEYTSHVHCDWRYDSVDPLLFGAAALGDPALDFMTPSFSAQLELEAGVLSAPAEGFDEGEPLRRWTALAADGSILDEAIGDTYVPPRGTATVEVIVGARLELSTDLEASE